jgi:hypothetical protein
VPGYSHSAAFGASCYNRSNAKKSILTQERRCTKSLRKAKALEQGVRLQGYSSHNFCNFTPSSLALTSLPDSCAPSSALPGVVMAVFTMPNSLLLRARVLSLDAPESMLVAFEESNDLEGSRVSS